ncbi:unnamed protein product [Ixodes hexagonus]
MISAASADVDTTVRKLNGLWVEIGIKGDDITKRLGKLELHIKQMLDDSLAGEVEMRDRLLLNIEECSAELAVLARELHVEVERPTEDLSILAREELLRAQVHELNRLKASRRRELKKLRAQEHLLCARLDVAPHPLDARVPSESDLNKLGEYVLMLKQEEGQRTAQLSNLRAEALTLLEELSVAPTDPFHMQVISGDTANLGLSTKNLAAAAAYVEELKSLRAARIAERSKLRRRLSQYWKRLDIPQSQQEDFTSEHTGLSEEALEAMKGELARCEALKRERLQEFVQRLRDELLQMYTKCGVPERMSCLGGASEAEECTEEHLQTLEAELSLVRAFYDENEAILEKVERREFLWGRLLEFERRARDPGRFNNRGGGLLVEERERKRLEKELPRLEQELLDYIAAHVAGGSGLFKEWSTAFKVHLDAQYASYREEKENERLARETRRNLPALSKGTKRAAPSPAQQSKLARLGMSTASSSTTLRAGTPLSVLGTPRAAARQKVTAARRRSLKKGAKNTPSKCQQGDATLSTTAASSVSFRGFTAGLNSEKRHPSTRSTLLPSTEPWKASYKYERTLTVSKPGRRLQF